MKKYFFICAFVILICISAAVFLSGQNSSSNLQTSPKLFAEGIINTSADEYNPTFTPDGKTVYFTRRIDRKGNEAIMFSKLENGKWTTPTAAEFSGKFSDKEPMLAPDGKRIFFASTRPNGSDEKTNFDIWMSEKTEKGWGEAKNLGANVNSSGYDNYPSIANDGTLYFASVRQNGRKDNDLYRSRLVNGEYQKAENLGDIINTAATEADPFVAPDQSYMIFSSDREGGAGEGDLYISYNQSSKWTAPQSLGANLNTADYEYTPLVSPDGKTFYFSRGWGDIYQIDASALNLSGSKQMSQAIDTKAKYLFYLHGKIVEDQGVKAVSERFGAYEYEKIVENFKQHGFVVISESRPKDTDIEKYAEKVAAQIRELLKSGVAAEKITVVGASKGSWIAMFVSTYLKNKDVNFVIIAGCGVNKEFLNSVNLYGNVLSIYEKSDVTGNCQAVFDDAEGINKRKEVMLQTGLAHGFIYRPMKEWIAPAVDWANKQQ